MGANAATCQLDSSSNNNSYRFSMASPDWLPYLQEHGYVVIANPLNAGEVMTAREFLWRDIERVWPGSGPGNWEKMKVPAHGLCPELAQSAGAWHVRGNTNVKHVFEQIWGGEKELICSMDAVICWRPWGDKASIRRPRTEGFHLDQNPFNKPNLEVVQGMVPLYDVTPVTGGLCVVPGSHKQDAKEALKQRCQQFKNAGDWCPLPKADPCIGEQILLEAEAGDLILWESRTVHGGRVGDGPKENDEEYFKRWNSHLARLSVTVAMTQLRRASEETLQARKQGFLNGACFNHTPHEMGTSTGTIKAPSDATYRPCDLTSAQQRLLDGAGSCKKL